jgi:5-methylcytosine-specific restriction endonuclease McrA
MEKYSKTLVLDSSDMPRSITSSQRAFVIVYKGNATVIENYDGLFKVCNPLIKIYKPSIIRVPKYVNVRHHKVPLTRENIIKRDNYECVYCGDNNARLLTIDHVIPQSKGGTNSWDNLVAACKKCNGEKADLSLTEFGKDIQMPKRPHYLMLLKALNYIPDEWKKYLFINE